MGSGPIGQTARPAGPVLRSRCCRPPSLPETKALDEAPPIQPASCEQLQPRWSWPRFSADSPRLPAAGHWPVTTTGPPAPIRDYGRRPRRHRCFKASEDGASRLIAGSRPVHAARRRAGGLARSGAGFAGSTAFQPSSGSDRTGLIAQACAADGCMPPFALVGCAPAAPVASVSPNNRQRRLRPAATAAPAASARRLLVSQKAVTLRDES